MANASFQSPKHATPLPISFENSGFETASKATDKERDGEMAFFSKSENALFIFQQNNLWENGIELRYRGALVPNHDLEPLTFLNLCVDLQVGYAADLLSASRDTLTAYGREYVSRIVQRGLAEVFPKYLASLKAKVSAQEALNGN